MIPPALRRSACKWFRREARQARKAHGAAWPDHRGWIFSYLREEVRQRLGKHGYLQPDPAIERIQKWPI